VISADLSWESVATWDPLRCDRNSRLLPSGWRLRPQAHPTKRCPV